MTYITTPNDAEADSPAPALAREDQTPYPYAMLFADGWTRAYADTLAELVAILVSPGQPEVYLGASEEAQRDARVLYAVGEQALYAATTLDPCDPNSEWWNLTPAERGMWVSGPCPTDWSMRNNGSAVWRSGIPPIALISTGYHPHTDHEPVQDEEGAVTVQWIDPSSEESLLRTLDASMQTILVSAWATRYGDAFPPA